MKPLIQSQLQSRLYHWLMRKTTPSAVRRVGELPIGIGSDIGNSRNENQDRLAVLKVQLESNQSFVVVALCDGMGGMAEGSACASQALASFFISCLIHRHLSPSNRLSIAAHNSNKVVHALYKGRGGATLSAILVDSSNEITGVNIGDSRIYSSREFRLEQITVDDTMAGLRPNAINGIHSRNELLQYIGMGDGIEPHILSIPMTQDLIVLTSDGTHYFDQGVMQMLILNAKEPALAVRRLIEVAKWCGSRDNASAAAISPLALQKQLFDDTGLIQVSDSFGDLQMFVAETDFSNDHKMEQLKILLPIVQAKPQHKKRSAKTSKKQTLENPTGQLIEQLKKDAGKKEQPNVNIYFNRDLEKS